MFACPLRAWAVPALVAFQVRGTARILDRGWESCLSFDGLADILDRPEFCARFLAWFQASGTNPKTLQDRCMEIQSHRPDQDARPERGHTVDDYSVPQLRSLGRSRLGSLPTDHRAARGLPCSVLGTFNGSLSLAVPQAVQASNASDALADLRSTII